jgi:HPt (histidine-containing phosphotransfer) domain-containing protein
MPADDDLRRELAALSAEYRASLPQRLEAIDRAWLAAQRGEGCADALHTLLRALHSIAGSAPTFGFPDLGRSAAEAESWIEPYSGRGEAPPAELRGAFERLLDALRQAAGD